ncbi:hypothetical protein X743_07235 [Mesorhizobium sp. LNHC252B00]|uniref:SIR2 family protein n=1 Tax=Mesorhizobium sp. LNHC252B00 TaxID=1287252 RepID=UPI0003CE0682|nr:SIR2 family protein [Mesorhizobium sp. LNHC252B00]ESY75032.1 hypothetical protein X743_07235 [Mesorhizobium sp. LNHC252B00]
MRFIENGPSIPDLLLERRDQGRVVFLCGAGVSFNAGMPTFVGLTKHVIDTFDPPKGSTIASSFEPWENLEYHGSKTPLDQIFHLLHQEYGREDVNALVAKRLAQEALGEIESVEHKLIARISSDQEGNPQIVTTNFDRLFERAAGVEVRKIYEPPAFPDIRMGVPITGVTYLHGRLQEPGATHHPYVLSSADFGRAYLSEGWATSFVRSLLESYTVVLVGYQAEDPPVKYLLQGLNHDGMSDRSNLYAFDKGLAEEIEAKWRDRGVTAIAYNDHSDLWKCLGAWADRANDPRVWRSKVVDLARRGPREVASYERGQVAHLVRTTPGARLFASADPSPPAEWLCVFDAFRRTARKSSGYGDSAETFDPLETYGLDDDPPRPPESDRQAHQLHDHLLEWRRGDTNPPTFHRLAGRQIEGFEDIPPRLLHLMRWIIKHLDSPVTAWWAVRQNGLHPRFAEQIRRELRQRTNLHHDARNSWNLIVEFQSDHRNFGWDDAWFELKDRINNEGWSPSVLRQFETLSAPVLSRDLPFGIALSKPPFGNWDEIGSTELTNWAVKFADTHGEQIKMPDEVLYPVFRIAEGHLFRASRLLEELARTYFTTPTCYPNREIDGEDRDRDGDANFRQFLSLFARMLEHSPGLLRAHALSWPVSDKSHFRKLKLFALNNVGLFGADEAADVVLGLEQDQFWDFEVRRELLFLIHDRWKEFSSVSRLALADRLLEGPNKAAHWSDKEYPEIRDEIAARYARWLTLQGRQLSVRQNERLDEIILALPDWREGSASSIVAENGVHAGLVGTDESPDAVIDLPLSEIVEKAEAAVRRDFGSFTEKRPFTGLVKTKPRKALASLSFTARNGVYPETLWSALIGDWPEDIRPRLYRMFLNRLGRLPEVSIRELRHTLGRWLEDKFIKAFEFDADLAWKIFDHIVDGLVSDGGLATASGMGATRVGNEIIHNSRRTYSHALNGPIGKASQGLFRALNSLKRLQGQGLPDEFKSRIERLLVAPREGSDHAVAMVAYRIGWLHYLDPAWVMGRIIPWFKLEHPSAEPAWNAFLSAARFPPSEIGVQLKPMLLQLFPTIYQWSWDTHLAEIAAQMVVELGVFQRHEPYGLDQREARHCIRNMDDRSRQHSVFRLRQIGKRDEGGWQNHVIPFVEEVWPRERKFRTSSLVSSWISLLDGSGDDFPKILKSVRRFLVPVENDFHRLYQFAKKVGGEEPLTVKHPEAVLEMLDAIIPNSPEAAPNELSQILDLIEDKDSALTRDRRFMRLLDLVEMK